MLFYLILVVKADLSYFYACTKLNSTDVSVVKLQPYVLM